MLCNKNIVFDNIFFSKALNIEAINNRHFIIKYFTHDSRINDNADMYCFIAIKGSTYDGNDFFDEAYTKGVRVFVLDKKPAFIPSDAIIFLVRDSLEALGMLAQFYKTKLFIPHILITGSIGKTTTRLLLAHILDQKYQVHTAPKNWNNAIGLPLTILATPFNAQISVLEAGMSTKGEIAHLSRIVNPDIAVITHIGYSHMANFSTRDDIAKAKIEIVEGMSQASLLLINKHDPYKDLFISSAKGNVSFFDPEDLKIVEDFGLKGFSFLYKKYPSETFFCPIPGSHLLLNLSIVFSCLDIFEFPLSLIQQGLNNVTGLDNRMRIFTNSKNITVIADCYNASLESFEAAFDVLKKAKGRKIAVIGGILELGSEEENIHRELGEKINRLEWLDLIFSLGPEISIAYHEITGRDFYHFDDLDHLSKELASILKEGDTVLLKGSHGIGLHALLSFLES